MLIDADGQANATGILLPKGEYAVALNASRANTFYASFKDISGTIDNQRLSISGVDEDEEAVNLVKYQNGYNLASKMIQTLTEIYDRLILETGV